MGFASPGQLVWLWLGPLVIFLSWWAGKRVAARLRNLAAKSNRDTLVGEQYGGVLWLKRILVAVAVALFVVALARPRWGFTWVDVRRNGVDIMLAVDLSTSMLAEDVKPNRLERAKWEIVDLLGMLKGDRLGLVAFAGAAFVQCPLTTDYRAAQMFVDSLNTGLVSAPGTALGDALRTATRSLVEASAAGSQGKAIVLITDGEDQSNQAFEAAQEAADQGIKVYTVGIGRDGGAPIPLPEGGFKKDADGNIVTTKLDERLLKEIAMVTGGTYVGASMGDLNLEQIYRKGIRKDLDTQELESSREKRWHERFQIPLALGLFLLLLEGILHEWSRRRRLWRDAFRLKNVVIAALVISTSWSQRGWADSLVRDAHEAYKKEQYSESSRKFLQAEVENPQDLETVYNRSVSQYREGDFANAEKGFSRSAESTDPEIRRRSVFNRGNSQVKQGKFDDAIASYDQVLTESPENKAAAENRAYAVQMKEIQKQQKEQQKQDEQKQDEQKDDEQKEGEQAQSQEQTDEGEQPQNEQPQSEQADAEPTPTDESQSTEPKEAMSEEEARAMLRGLDEASDKRVGQPRNMKAPAPATGKDW